MYILYGRRCWLHFGWPISPGRKKLSFWLLSCFIRTLPRGGLGILEKKCRLFKGVYGVHSRASSATKRKNKKRKNKKKRAATDAENCTSGDSDEGPEMEAETSKKVEEVVAAAGDQSLLDKKALEQVCMQLFERLVLLSNCCWSIRTNCNFSCMCCCALLKFIDYFCDVQLIVSCNEFSPLRTGYGITEHCICVHVRVVYDVWHNHDHLPVLGLEWLMEIQS